MLLASAHFAHACPVPDDTCRVSCFSSSNDEFENEARLSATSNVATDDDKSDFVDYMGQQTWDKDDGVKFQPSNYKKKKRFQHWIPEQARPIARPSLLLSLSKNMWLFC